MNRFLSVSTRSSLALVIALMVVACASTPNKAALQSLDVVRETVGASVKVLNANVVAGKVSEPDRLKAVELRKKYLAADKIAVDALSLTIQGTPGPVDVSKVQALAKDFIDFINSLSLGGA